MKYKFCTFRIIINKYDVTFAIKEGNPLLVAIKEGNPPVRTRGDATGCINDFI